MPQKAMPSIFLGADLLQLQDVGIARETLVKIERGIQYLTGSQLRGIRDCLSTTYDDLLK